MQADFRDAELVAISLCDTEWNVDSVRDHLQRALGCDLPDAQRLAHRLGHKLGWDSAPARKNIAAALLNDKRFRASRRASTTGTPAPIRIQSDPVAMRPRQAAFNSLDLPSLPTLRSLAVWLGLSNNELDWFARRAFAANTSSTRATPKLQHYHYHWHSLPSGKHRLIETPKARLKQLQRQILRELLDQVPVHSAAHGFTRGRSTRTHAQRHCAAENVLCMDFNDYFVSVTRARARGLFTQLGYPQRVADSLAGICTHRTNPNAYASEIDRLTPRNRRALNQEHLPQGAPTSPRLANLCTYRFDLRLTELANRIELSYSRYADDISLSGAKLSRAKRAWLEARTAAIALEEGFSINHRKTRWQPNSQQQRICGVVTNAHPNVDRKSFDALKALLHNCVKDGPTAHNRAMHPDFKRHLEGRVAYVRHLNPRRAFKLERLLSAITW